MSTDKILDKIKKLMKLQQSAEKIGSIEEAETVACKIQELLASHNLSADAIDMTEEKMTNCVGEEEFSYHCGTSGVNWRLNLMGVIAKYNFCRCINYETWREKERMKLFGSEANIEVVKYIYEMMLRTFIQANRKACKKYFERGDVVGITRHSFYKSFLNGCVAGLASKLKEEAEAFANANKKMNGVMVVNDKAISNFIAKKYEQTKSRASSGKIAMGAYEQGKEVGKSASWNKALKTQPVTQVNNKQLN